MKTVGIRPVIMHFAGYDYESLYNERLFECRHISFLLGTFAKFAKSACLLHPVHSSVRSFACISTAPTRQIFLEFGIEDFYEKLSNKLKLR
jgi:hypothetical protein